MSYSDAVFPKEIQFFVDIKSYRCPKVDADAKQTLEIRVERKRNLKVGDLGEVSFRIYAMGELSEVSSGMLKLGKLSELSFGIYKLGKLGDVSFRIYIQVG